jgi:hypothetical protein
MSCVILGARSICIYLIHMIVGKCVSSDVQDSLQHTAFDKGYFTSSSWLGFSTKMTPCTQDDGLEHYMLSYYYALLNVDYAVQHCMKVRNPWFFLVFLVSGFELFTRRPLFHTQHLKLQSYLKRWSVHSTPNVLRSIHIAKFISHQRTTY